MPTQCVWGKEFSFPSVLISFLLLSQITRGELIYKEKIRRILASCVYRLQA